MEKTNFNCVRCETLKEPIKRYEKDIYDWIFSCVECKTEFENYELLASKTKVIVDRRIKQIEEDFQKGLIPQAELSKKVLEAMQI